MDWSTLERSEGMTQRSVRSKWYYWLVAWVDKIKGGPGDIGLPPRMCGTGASQAQENEGNQEDQENQENQENPENGQE